jgi:beta-phosphoglucomutase-like phosphatase (HAD superfamily)
MIKAILMDFNGVVIDDEPIQMKAYQEVLAQHGVALTEEDYYASLGMDDRTFVQAAFKRAQKNADDQLVREITRAKTRRWSEMVELDMPIFHNMPNFIEKMSHDFALGLVSMANRDEIDHILERADLREFFDVIVSAEDVNACKPDPECYRTGFRLIDTARTSAGHLPITHGECLVIEDSPPGIAAARNADLRTLGVTNTVPADDLRKAGAEYVAWNLDDWMPDTIRRVFA